MLKHILEFAGMWIAGALTTIRIWTWKYEPVVYSDSTIGIRGWGYNDNAFATTKNPDWKFPAAVAICFFLWPIVVVAVTLKSMVLLSIIGFVKMLNFSTALVLPSSARKRLAEIRRLS